MPSVSSPASSPGSLPGSSPGVRTSVALTYALFVLVGVNAGAGGVLLAEQIRDYGVDKGTFGITFMTFSVGFVLAGTASGNVLQRFGTRAALLAGSLTCLLAGVTLATRPPFAVLVATQLVSGLGTGMLETVLNTYLADLPRATTLLNRLHAFFGVGALLGPPLTTATLRVLSWPTVCLLLAAAYLPLACGFAVVSQGRPGHASAPGGHAGGTAGAPTGHGRNDADATPLLAAALRQRAVLLSAGLLAVYVGLEISVGTWAFSFLVESHGQSDLTAGYTVSGYWAGLTLGRFLISPLAARRGWTTARMMSACIVATPACTALMWITPSPVTAVAGFLLLGFLLGPVFPTAMAIVPDLTSARLVPTAIGVLNSVSAAGGALFPWLAGTLAQQVGMWTLLPYATAIGVWQLVIWWPLARRLATPSEAVPEVQGQPAV